MIVNKKLKNCLLRESSTQYYFELGNIFDLCISLVVIWPKDVKNERFILGFKFRGLSPSPSLILIKPKFEIKYYNAEKIYILCQTKINTEIDTGFIFDCVVINLHKLNKIELSLTPEVESELLSSDKKYYECKKYSKNCSRGNPIILHYHQHPSYQHQHNGKNKYSYFNYFSCSNETQMRYMTYYPIQSGKECVYSITNTICELLIDRNKINDDNIISINYEWKHKYFK